MINITDKSKCSGCHACFNICPRHCIEMVKDEEGFLYPKVREDRCISCGLCEKVCQAVHPIHSDANPEAYACYNKDAQILEKSSSGGVFTLLAEEILKDDGVVFGSAFDEKFVAGHVAVYRAEELWKLRGSKYVQSIIGDTYAQAEAFLKEGREVLFTGTPCQIDGLIHYLRKPYQNLYTQDLICHGVPSPRIWEEYVAYREKLQKSRAERIRFRCKDNGWHHFVLKFEYRDGSEYSGSMSEDPYWIGFLKNYFLRPSCYGCLSRSMPRNSDITLADYWGVEKIDPEMFNERGVSLVILHSEKGTGLFDRIKDRTICKKTDLHEAIRYNSPAVKSVAKPAKRDWMISQFIRDGFTDRNIRQIKRIGRVTLTSRIKNRLKMLLKRA